MSEQAPQHEQISALAQSKAFLGREFLTWLWYVAETHEGMISIPAKDEGADKLELDLWVDDRLVLESSSAMAHENVMKGGDPSRSREASAALGGGKTVKEMKLGVNVKGVGEFSAILHCDELTPRSLKLPKPGENDAAQSAEELPLLLRIRQTELFLSVVDGLFARFLARRTEAQWESGELKAIRSWIRERQSDRNSGKLH